MIKEERVKKELKKVEENIEYERSKIDEKLNNLVVGSCRNIDSNIRTLGQYYAWRTALRWVLELGD